MSNINIILGPRPAHCSYQLQGDCPGLGPGLMLSFSHTLRHRLWLFSWQSIDLYRSWKGIYIDVNLCRVAELFVLCILSLMYWSKLCLSESIKCKWSDQMLPGLTEQILSDLNRGAAYQWVWWLVASSSKHTLGTRQQKSNNYFITITLMFHFLLSSMKYLFRPQQRKRWLDIPKIKVQSHWTLWSIAIWTWYVNCGHLENVRKAEIGRKNKFQNVRI